LGLSDIISM